MIDKDGPSTAVPAFTLIELLVVITIITILAGLLLPVLVQVRDKARESNCRGNLKQLTVAVILYADDHRGYGPPNCLDFMGAAKYPFPAAAREGELAKDRPWFFWLWGDYMAEDVKALICPGREEVASPPHHSSYGYNGFVNNGGDLVGFVLKKHARRLEDFRQPDYQFLLTDAKSPFLGDMTGDYTQIFPHHGGEKGQVNIGFFDGHVDSMWKEKSDPQGDAEFKMEADRMLPDRDVWYLSFGDARKPTECGWR